MNILNDSPKMYDFITLTKEEFLKVYNQITADEYENILAIYNLI